MRESETPVERETRRLAAPIRVAMALSQPAIAVAASPFDPFGLPVLPLNGRKDAA